MRFEGLTRDPLRLALAPKHPLARKRVVTLAEAVREPFIAYSRKDYPEYHEILASVFAATKVAPRIAEEQDGVSSLIAAVEAGGGVALMPESLSCLAGARLKLMPLSPAPEPLVVGAAWAKDGLTSGAERFLKSVKMAISIV